MEMMIMIFLVAVISMAVSNIIFNNNKNMIYLKSMIMVDEIANKESYRARIGLPFETYDDISIEQEIYLEQDALNIEGLSLEYIDITVSHKKNDIKKTVTIVRRALNE